uniref:Putative mediator of rna polymerase ii transcription subunit 12 n=1 Tax=Anopheles marajoara TaxID=58244 RepID=A0A2M4BBZ2_9DIPT
MHLRRRLASLACILQLLYLAPCAGSILTQGIRERPPSRTVRRTNGLVADRPNAIDPSTDLPPAPPPPSQLQLKYYDVVQVDVVQSAADGEPDADAPLTLLTSGAGEGKSSAPPPPPPITTKPQEQAAKTLADQVAEGKYGLIHRELFQQRPQRFGVLSYRRNEEVPLDDERNYGGLQPDEIWLAEDHLLVLKGGAINFNNNGGHRGGGNRSSSSSSSSSAGPWKPIDDYRAPDRQVEIPLNPPVPPPFPVQLRENGPIEFIRGHQAAAFNPFTNESAFLFSNKAFPVIRPEDFGGPNLLARPAALNHTGQHNGLQYPAPVNPPPISDNRTYSNPFLKLPPLPGGPFPGAVRPDDVRGTQNLTAGGRDEDDDPSLYYPPPYSFEYKSNYTNPVPPGPLVPGIILPPPPNFFILKPAEPSKAAENEKQLKKNQENQEQQQQQQQEEAKEAKKEAGVSANTKYTDRPKGTVTSSPVEIQKAVLKSFVPMIELYGSGGPGATVPLRKPYATKRLRPKPTAVPALSRAPPVTVSLSPSLPPSTTPSVPSVSTKLHKIAAPGPEPEPVKQAPHPIYAEYFNIKSSTPASWGDTSFTTTPSRTYLPSKGQQGRGGHEQQQQQQQHHHHGELVRTYGYSPIEQFHREVNTIRQTLQIYEKANKLAAKAARTSKAQQHTSQAHAGTPGALYHHHQQQQQQQQQHDGHDLSGPGRNLSGTSVSFGGDQLYHAFYSDVVVPSGPIVASYKAYAASGDEVNGAPDRGAGYGGYYEPVTPPAYQVYRPTNVQELPHGYIVTTGEAAFPRPYHSQIAAPYYQQRHRQLPELQQQQQQQLQQPPQLSYIAPVILNNGASGYNRLPEHHGGTTTKSYLILDHRTTERLRQRQQHHQHQHHQQQQQQQIVQQPYLRYRHRATGDYEHEQEQLPTGNRYLEDDILVNYKHPLPALNPDSEYLPYHQPPHHHHQRLQIRKRQNGGGGGGGGSGGGGGGSELASSSFFSSATQQAIFSQSGR